MCSSMEDLRSANVGDVINIWDGKRRRRPPKQETVCYGDCIDVNSTTLTELRKRTRVEYEANA